MTSTESIISVCKAMLEEGSDVESVLVELRKCGYSKIESVKVLVDFGEAPLSKAKKIVHNSIAWRDKYENDTTFQERLYKIEPNE